VVKNKNVKNVFLSMCDVKIFLTFTSLSLVLFSGADPGFEVRGAHLKKLRRAEGGATIFGVFRVKNHDFTPKNHIYSNFRGGARRVRPPLDPPLVMTTVLPVLFKYCYKYCYSDSRKL
jgi:hypothetical protein